MTIQVERRIDELFRHVDGYLHWVEQESQATSPANVGDPPVAWAVEQAEHLIKRARACRKTLGTDIQRVGGELAAQLNTLGEDPSGLHSLIVRLEPHGGGPDAFVKRWPDVKAWLLRITMQGNARQPEGTANKTGAPENSPLPPRQQEVLNAIPRAPEGRTSAEIATIVGTKDDVVRATVKALRDKGYPIENTVRVGYYMPA